MSLALTPSKSPANSATATTTTTGPLVHVHRQVEGPLATASKVQEMAGLCPRAEQVGGYGEDTGEAAFFCFVDGAAKRTLAAALQFYATTSTFTFTPTFIHINRAAKALSSYSAAPCLSFDATLPQHRVSEAECTTTIVPAQSQYPV
ncbi:uncharacterized protein BDV17DRAFT_290395 [Aspergillus undulatus]|uniref:uncharacterized protein n=1 Tax=Aspergillus undulatus TaxID=1810928 RepID=UPI003CCE501D